MTINAKDAIGDAFRDDFRKAYERGGFPLMMAYVDMYRNAIDSLINRCYRDIVMEYLDNVYSPQKEKSKND